MSDRRVTSERATEGEAHIGLTPSVPVVLVEIETAERVWSRGPRPDPAWTFTDHSGHAHAYATRTDTLAANEVREPCGDPECICEGEGYTRTVWRCRKCFEVIEPGLIHGPYAVDVPWRPEWRMEARGEILTGPDEVVMVTVALADGRTLAGTAVCLSWSMGAFGGARSTWEGVGELRPVQ